MSENGSRQPPTLAPGVKIAPAEQAGRASFTEVVKMARQRYQTGSLEVLGKRQPKYVLRYYEPVLLPDGKVGKTRRAVVLGRVSEVGSKRQARLLADSILRKFNSGGYRPQAVISLAEFVQNTWEPAVIPLLKYSTQQHYRHVLRVHVLPAFGNRQLADLSREEIHRFLLAKSSSELSWKSVKHIRATLTRVLGCAEEWGYLAINPAQKIRLPRRGPKRQKPIPTPEQIRTLVAILREPARSLTLLVALTGLRIGEALALRWRNVDLTTGAIRVAESVYDGHFAEPKTITSIRSVPISAEVLRMLTSLRPGKQDPEALVFATRAGGPLNRRNLLRRHLQPACQRLGLPPVSWHTLRHACATMLDTAGTPLGVIQELLGHASSEITRAIYLHAIPSEQRRAVENLERLLFGLERTQLSGFEQNAPRLID